MKSHELFTDGVTMKLMKFFVICLVACNIVATIDAAPKKPKTSEADIPKKTFDALGSKFVNKDIMLEAARLARQAKQEKQVAIAKSKAAREKREKEKEADKERLRKLDANKKKLDAERAARISGKQSIPGILKPKVQIPTNIGNLSFATMNANTLAAGAAAASTVVLGGLYKADTRFKSLVNRYAGNITKNVANSRLGLICSKILYRNKPIVKEHYELNPLERLANTLTKEQWNKEGLCELLIDTLHNPLILEDKSKQSFLACLTLEQKKLADLVVEKFKKDGKRY